MDVDPDAPTDPVPVIPAEALDPWQHPDVALANTEPF